MPAFLHGRGGLPAAPLDIKAEQAKADALIQYAVKVKDWPLLEQAIDVEIEQQREFIRWWDETVQPNNRPPLTVSGSETVSAAQAAALTEIGKVQVSRWSKRLADADKYRAQQLLAAYRKAGLEPLANHRAEGTGEYEGYTPATRQRCRRRRSSPDYAPRRPTLPKA